MKLKKLQALHRTGVTHNAICPGKILLPINIMDTNLYLIGLRDARKITKYAHIIESGETGDRTVRLTKFSGLSLHLGSCKL